MDMTNPLMIVVVMIATTGFAALGVIFWSGRRDSPTFEREMGKWES